MDNFIWIGSALGAVLGLLHGVYLCRQQTARALALGTTGSKAKGFYYGFWAQQSKRLLLWLLGLRPLDSLWGIRGARPDTPI